MTTSNPANKTLRPFDPGAAPNVTTRWQDMKQHDKFFYYTSALNENQKACLFTVQFTHLQRDLMEDSKMSRRNYIAQRFRAQHSRAKLSRTPLFFVIEGSPTKLLHVHGVLDPRNNSEKDIKSFLKNVSGDGPITNTGIDRFFKAKIAVKISLQNWGEKSRKDNNVPASKKTGDHNYGPYGWANYMLKNIEETSAYLGMKGPPIYVSHDLTAAAKQLHAGDVAFARTYAAH